MHALLHSVAPTLQQATTNPRFRWKLLDTHRQVWGHCSFLLGPDAQGSVCALQEFISQSWQLYGGVNGDLIRGLMLLLSRFSHVELCATP